MIENEPSDDVLSQEPAEPEFDRKLREHRQENRKTRQSERRKAVGEAYFVHDLVMCELINELADVAQREGWPKKRKDLKALKLYQSETQRQNLLHELVGAGIIKKEGEHKRTRYSLALRGGSLQQFLTKGRASKQRWERQLKRLSEADGSVERYQLLLLQELADILNFAFYANEYKPKARRFLDRMFPQETDRLVKIITTLRKANSETATQAFHQAIAILENQRSL